MLLLLHSREKKNDESYLLDPEKKIKRYDNIMENSSDGFQSSGSGNDKDNEDSFLTLSTKIVTFPNTPTICYFQMVESYEAFLSSHSTTRVRRSLTLKEKWRQSKLKKLAK